jgi:mucosal vascular addressin cell adhesion protein 1
MDANHDAFSVFAVLFYNVSLDVHRKAESPSRFYFFSNGTSDVITGSIRVSSSGEKCRTHQAFMRVRETT